jgi:tetratricopeptide (TPR) repeat protein
MSTGASSRKSEPHSTLPSPSWTQIAQSSALYRTLPHFHGILLLARLAPGPCYLGSVSNLLIGLIGALVATNQPAAVSNLVTQTTGITVNVPDPNDPVEKEYKKIMADDDAAQAEVDLWIRENKAFADKGGGAPNAVLNERIHKRLDLVRAEYDAFIKLHPDHARIRLAYGAFLDDIKDDEGAVVQWEKAREIEPKNPATWNNLANHYGHEGPVAKAFEYYEKAIELNPSEPVYYQNFGTTVFLFRKDAMEYYKIDEQKVFDKALALYEKGVKLDPTNFELAQDLAETYYGIKPTRTDDALNAWTNALKIADNEIEREGVYIHLARFKNDAGRFDEARKDLTVVTNVQYADLKNLLTRNIAKAELKARGGDTNTPPATPAATNAAPAKAEIK